MEHLIVFATTFAVFLTGHYAGDFWVQTEWQALTKSSRNREGSIACLRHVLGLQMTKLVLFLPILLLGLSVSPWALFGGLLFDGLTHYWADRRYTLRWLAELVGRGGFYPVGQAPLGTGAHALDQSFHIISIYFASVIVAMGA